MRIPYCLLEYFASSKDLRSLAIIIYLKSRFKNGCYYGTDVRGLADKLDISKTAAAKYLKIVSSHKALRYHAGNTCFIGYKELCKLLKLKEKDGIVIVKNYSVKKILSQLQHLMLKRKFNQFQCIKQKTSELLNPTGPNAAKIFKSARKFMKKRNPINAMTNYSVSYASIGYRLGISRSSAFNVIKDLINKNLLIKTGRFLIVKQIHRKALIWCDTIPNTFVSKNMNVIKIQRNEYFFL